MWGEHTHISEVEYWRWWLVHLWVEGFFEVFATAVMALIFTRLGLIRTATANITVLFATIMFMAGGVLGTLHHLYFVGTPISVVALGASFSALEVVPLAYIGFEAYHTWKLGRATPWMARYRWPVLFFIAVSFWNLVGAGLFGFLINPPLSLYYMQGLNLTPLHGHTALFGVYGMLGIALVLFCLRGLRGQMVWDTRLLKVVVLVPQYRPGADGAADIAATGHDAVVRGDRARLRVRTVGRVHAAADRQAADLDARAGRHHLQRRRAVARLVRAEAVDRAQARSGIRGRTGTRALDRIGGTRRAAMPPVALPAGHTRDIFAARTDTMDTTSRPFDATLSPRMLAHAPHRLMFFIGASNVLLAMAWWAAWLASTRWQWFAMPQPTPYAGWLHAFVMQYQVLPSFFFGFLLTTFPRWMGLPDIRALALPARRHRHVRRTGRDTARCVSDGRRHLRRRADDDGGWSAGLVASARRCCARSGRTWHARSCFAALCLGWLGLLAWLGFLLGASPLWAFASIKIGSFGLLLPVFVTVAHRMFPFFAGNVVPGYKAWRPLWLLGAFWALALCTWRLNWCTAIAGCGRRTSGCSHDDDDAVALVAARIAQRTAGDAVRRAGVAAGRVRAVLGCNRSRTWKRRCSGSVARPRTRCSSVSSPACSSRW